MELTFNANITAADAKTRTIIGQIVPFGVVAPNTSLGAALFEAGSIHIPDNVKVLLEHDLRRPVGKVVNTTANPGGIFAEMKIAETTSGNDLLIEAAEGLRDGISVGVDIVKWTTLDGVMRISAAELTEVSLVANPAFKDARVTSVAASETPETPDGETAPEETTTQGETMDEQNSAPVEAETVTASAVTVQASAPAAYTKPRSPIVTAAAYIQHKVQASRGDQDSMQYVMAADAQLSKTDQMLRAGDTADIPGLVHDSWLNEVITTSLGTTAAIDAVGVSPLVESGMSFKIPAATQYPTVATTAEGAAASDTDMVVGDIDVTIVKKAGKQVITFEAYDRSTPAYYDEVLRQLRVALGKNKDEYLLAQLVAGGTAAATTAGTIAGLQSFIATESSSALLGSGDFADILIASPDWWTAIKAAKDTTGRSLYNALAPMNANGVARVNSLRGEVDGAALYVDPFLAAGSGLIDNSALLMSMESARYWESPIRQVQVNNLADGSIIVEYYQYVAAQVVKSTGVRKFNLT